MGEQSENFLDMLEGIGQLVSTLDQIRTGLEERGWDSLQAQITAREAYCVIVASGPKSGH